MTGPRNLPSKKDVVLMLLENADVFIHLDPRREHVIVPPHLKQQAHLILQIGLNMPVAIPDLEVTDEGITCTLSFNRSPVWCRLPWSSIYAVVSNDTDARGMVWPDDVPSEVAFRFIKQGESPAPPSKPAVVPVPAPAPVPVPVPDGDAVPPVSARPSNPGRRKSAKGKARGVPLPVPSSTPDPAPVPAEAASEREGDAPVSAPPPDSKKPKRELPPYLRVIK